MKYCILLIFLICSAATRAQRIFAENFDSATLAPQWQIVSGNWHRADVQDLRIAPAENGRQYVLRADSMGYIRLFIDLPDSSKGKKLQFRFSYYSYFKGIAPNVEAEFYKKEMKDGTRGKPMKWNLLITGRWTPITKTLTIPPDANQFRVVFFNPHSSRRGPCLDVVSATVLK